MELTKIRSLAQKIKENINLVVVGKGEVIDQLLVAMIASGHVLLEDVPGTGKTLLAKTMAKSLNCKFSRIQFTPDLLPSDLTGINYFNQQASRFEFRPGPIFTNILLADEINRATPRTQSSLLECMEEQQVTIDGETKPLTRPFMVIATQNPIENSGTFPLPEAQMDRFLIKINMGYPSSKETVDILKRFKESSPMNSILSSAEGEDIIAAQNSYSQVKVSDEMYDYMVQIVEATRSHTDVAMGVSPRGSQSLLKAIQVYAILQGRDYVLPDDIKAMAKPVLSHRLTLNNKMRTKENKSDVIIDQILHSIPVPAEDKLNAKIG